MRRLTTVALVLAVSTVACDEAPTDVPATPDGTAEVTQADPTHAGDKGPPSWVPNPTATFPTWRQNFNSGTDGWITDDTPGITGWCGDIEHLTRSSGPVRPSASRGYALAGLGGCNEFFTERGFPPSGPFSYGSGFSSGWPASGFVYELDIYLDVELGTSFLYAASLCQLQDGECGFLEAEELGEAIFHYFPVSVAAGEDAVSVAGHEIAAPGWYTFRHVFGSDDGKLTVDFQLADGGRVLLTKPITETLALPPAIPSVPTSSFDVADLGSGYQWFVTIADGLQLPIDEQAIRRGG